MLFCRLLSFLSFADFVRKQLFLKIVSGIQSESNGLDQTVWGDLGPNYLQRLSADNTSRLKLSHSLNVHVLVSFLVALDA